MSDVYRSMTGYKKQIIAGLIAGLALTGCASQILNGFVGRDVGTVIARYGPYESSFDLPDGRRAFQWKIVESGIVPTETTAQDVETRRGTTQTVRTTGGYWKEETCFYTVYAVPSEAGGWTIVGYEKPSFDCE